MHVRFQGVQWFVHPLVAQDLVARGYPLRSDRAYPYLLGEGGAVHVLAASVPVKSEHARGTYCGGWSTTIDERDPVCRLLKGAGHHAG